MNILSKVALLSLFFATNNAEVLRPKKLASKQGGTTPAPPTTTIAGSEDIPPPCITPSSNGDDQRACGPGAVCIGTSSFGVSCDQRGLESPSCVTDGCNQDGSNSPSCLGGGCSQVGVTGNVSCSWGCNQSNYQGGGSPSCSGGNCCWTTGVYPGTCAGAPKQSKVSWGCNTNSKSCRRVEVYEFEEDEFEEQVEAAKTKNYL